MNQPQPSRPKLVEPATPSQDTFLKRARASLRQLLTRHSLYHTQLQPELQDELNLLAAIRDKLDQGVVRIAAFGLVSRGKSAVLNALVGQKVFQTGPLNGVTRWPRSVLWCPSDPTPEQSVSKIQVELIDTPGLDEIEGQANAQMARDVTAQADLILFVISGDLTRTEFQALCELREAQKPLILVFNKVDLYPDRDRDSIYQNIQDQRLRQLISPTEVVMTAAEPAPVQVRVEWANGQVTHEWESPPAQVEQLQHRLLEVLNREGRPLIALNALFEARDTEIAIMSKVFTLRESEAQALIWRFVRWKALGVALNPVALLDLLGGTISDLMLIRALARLYGCPITQFEAGRLWKTIFLSAGGVLLGNLGTGLTFSLAKSTTAFTEGIGGVSTYVGMAIAQAGTAAYGTYIVGEATQRYLRNGCTWGNLGPSTIVQETLAYLDPDSVLNQIRQELQTKLEHS